jgi:hypothetical protein
MQLRPTLRRAALAAAVAALAVPAGLAAQAAPASLSLEEALELARQHNPDYLSQANDLVSCPVGCALRLRGPVAQCQRLHGDGVHRRR